MMTLGGKAPRTNWEFKCFDSQGNLKWEDGFSNLVVDEGVDYLLTEFFKGAAYTAAFFVGLKGAGAVAAGDTMASHAGWADETVYSNATRPAFTPGAVAAKAVDNSASPAVFNVNGVLSLSGGFICTDSAKGGTTGTLYAAGDFATARVLGSGDVLQVTVSVTG